MASAAPLLGYTRVPPWWNEALRPLGILPGLDQQFPKAFLLLLASMSAVQPMLKKKECLKNLLHAETKRGEPSWENLVLLCADVWSYSYKVLMQSWELLSTWKWERKVSYPFHKDMHIFPPSRFAAAFTTYHFKKKNPETIYICFLG